MGEKVSFGILHAKALLVALHARDEHFPGHFQIGCVKIAQKRHRMFHKACHFLQEGIVPEDATLDALGLHVALPNDKLAPLVSVRHDGSLLRKQGQKVFSLRHLKGSSAMDAVPGGHATAFHGTDFEGHDLVVEKGHNPLQGPCVGKVVVSPAHSLGKGNAGNDVRADPCQDVQGVTSAHKLFHGHVITLGSGDNVGLVHFNAIGAAKALQGLAGLAVHIGHPGGRSHDDLFPLLLFAGNLVYADNGAPWSRVAGDSAVGKASFIQSLGKGLGKVGLLALQETGRQLLAADFEYKGRCARACHYFASLSMG